MSRIFDLKWALDADVDVAVCPIHADSSVLNCYYLV